MPSPLKKKKIDDKFASHDSQLEELEEKLNETIGNMVQGEQLLALKKWKTEIKFAVFKDVFESELMKSNQMNLNNVMKTTQEVVTEVQTQSSLLDEFRHSIYIRTVSSYCLFFTLLNWLKLVYGLLGQISMHLTLNFCPNQPGRNQMYQS